MKPTVIFITGTLFQGGAERVISIISEKLLKNYDVNIVCFYSRPVFYKIASGVKLFDLEKDFGCKNIFSKALCLRKFLLSQKKCIVVAFMLPFYVFTVASLWGTNLKIVASERTDPRIHPLHRKVISRICLQKVNAFVAQTESAKSYYPLSIQSKTTIIYNPLSEDFYNNEYAPSVDIINIVTIGRFVKPKNLQLLINAFNNIQREFDNIILTIYGDGPLNEELQNLVKSLNLQNRILFPGYTSNVPKVLSEANIYVCSSNYEGLPNSLIEAMACGVPTISTKVAGAIDLIEDGVNGLLVNVDDLNAMSASLSKLCKDDSLRNRLGIEASKIRELVNPDLISEQWSMLLKKVIECRE